MTASDAQPRTIFIIRHGEKPPDSPPPHGVTVDGISDEHSLQPRGWQRAGALATLFAPQDGRLRAGLRTPTQLIAPAYAKAAPNERTHETMFPLKELLGLHVENPIAEGHEPELGKSAAEAHSGVTLICWEHKAIPVIAANICAPNTRIPGEWPDDRFDMVWSFTLDTASGTYAFAQIPQMLLAGDSRDVIPT